MISVDQADPFLFELNNLSNPVRGLEDQMLTHDDAIGQATAISALDESASLGRAIETPAGRPQDVGAP